ncbi:hypothetical protein TrRE_jg5017 [Triparma retinervis]|uniref:PA domain-containing protein n=1 Tax=Triparma retinervis TaxID=2557542 RepID=A0A9W7F853_9STRA|nr:hypothetical protein TrRE_jg5017 [Triparma retinervis]
MKLLIHKAALAVACLTSYVSADLDDTTTSRFQVEVPSHLFRDEGYRHREALFGGIPYGHEISQMVYYADSDLCDEQVDNRKGYPCTLESDGKCKPWETPFILMVDRGTCMFVEKVRRAQMAGAAAVLIADNLCTCASENSNQCQSNPGVQCEGLEPIMADDGSGGDITIPAFLLFKEDADILKDVLVNQNGLVQVKMTWDTPAPDDRVEWEFWHSPTEQTTKYFQSVFEAEAKGLGTHAFFTPHFAIWQRSQCIGNNVCDGLCTNGGRYCADDPDGPGSINGADVVIESLRRICIWNTHGTDGVGQKWWNYIKEFGKTCDDVAFPENFPSPQDFSCATSAMARAGIDHAAIESCMLQSGGTTSTGTNVLLDNEISALEQSGVFIFPAITINNKLMFGKIDNKNVFNAICAGFLDGTAPDVCNQCESCASNELENCAASGVCSSSPVSPGDGEKGGVSTGTLVGSLLFTVGIMGGAGFVYYRRQQAEMRDQVRGILAEYMPLDDDGLSTQLTSKGSGTSI